MSPHANKTQSDQIGQLAQQKRQERVSVTNCNQRQRVLNRNIRPLKMAAVLLLHCPRLKKQKDFIFVLLMMSGDRFSCAVIMIAKM